MVVVVVVEILKTRTRVAAVAAAVEVADLGGRWSRLGRSWMFTWAESSRLLADGVLLDPGEALAKAMTGPERVRLPATVARVEAYQLELVQGGRVERVDGIPLAI